MAHYTIKDNDQFNHFKEKLKNQPKVFIEAIGHKHKMNEFTIISNGQTCLSFENISKGSNFQIMIHHAKINYNVDLEKGNRVYTNYIDEVTSNLQNINCRNVELLGVSIGDLLKHFYYNNTECHILDQDEKINIQMNDIVKKSLRNDTTNSDGRDILGIYNHTQCRVYLWDLLRQTGYMSKGDNSLNTLCNKILYFSDLTINNLFKYEKNKDYHNKQELIKSHLNTSVKLLMNSLTNEHLIGKLLRYHLYNEDPFVSDDIIIYYDPPQFLTTILKDLYYETKDNRYNDKYNKIMKKLNAGEQKQMEKYPPQVFKSLKSIPENYPIFAYRNAIIKQWSKRNKGYFSSMLGDVHLLHRRISAHSYAVRNDRYKHKLNLTTKPNNVPLNYGNNGFKFDVKGKHKQKQITLHLDVNDYDDFPLVDDYDDYSD